MTMNEKLTSFYTRNIRYYYNVDILVKKLLMYNLPYSPNMFMRNFYDDKVRYSYEEVEMKKRIKYSLDRLYSIDSVNEKELKLIKNSAKPYKDLPSKNTLSDKKGDIPKLECESSSIFDMFLTDKKNVKIDEELLFKIFKQEVYEKIIKNENVTSLPVSMDEKSDISNQPEQDTQTMNPKLTCETENTDQEPYIEAARQEAEKEAAKQAKNILIGKSKL